jgi:heme/copper-type cytochrome/quinol oxidase subunit 2
VSQATRSAADAGWRVTDRTRGGGFEAAVRTLSVAMIVNLLMLIATSVGGVAPPDTDATVQTPSMFAPVSTPAFAIRDISYFVLGICAVIFVVVAALLTYSIIRFRRRRGEENREPPQVYGSNQIELAWTAVRGAIVAPPSMGLPRD